MASRDDDPRKLILDAFRAGLSATRGDRLVARALDASEFRHPPVLVAAGKAARAMARGASDALAGRIDRGLVIAPEAGAGDWPFPCRELAAEHPVPGQGSLAAGDALMEFLADAPAAGECLFLISGGASSLVEVPVTGIGLEDLQRANRWLLASGLDIQSVNAVRRRLSRIKGGGLLDYLGRREARVLAVSDVPGNDPAVIGSGWLSPPRDDSLPGDLPGWLADLVERGRPPGTQDSGIHERIRTRIIGDNSTAVEAAAAHLRAAGLSVNRLGERLAGEASDAGQSLGRDLAARTDDGFLLGGECTVTLPDAPGRGGRCQHLALAAAMEFAGRDDCWLLAAGTDGRDGESEAAGAVVDGGTVRRGEIEGLSAGESLARADSGTFLEAAGDLVDTGPTGTNVNDLVIGVRT